MKNCIPDQFISLDVGGLYFPKVSKKLLTSVPGSALAAMFSGRHEISKDDGKYFIDRDPEMFKHLIQYLRNGCQKVELESKRDA